MTREFGLGRGLSSLIPTRGSAPAGTSAVSHSHPINQPAEPPAKNSVIEVEVEKIRTNPHQPRTHFDGGKLEELSQSIKAHGILQPLVMSRVGEGYEIIAGERRFLAAQRAGLKTVPVIVRNAGEKEKLELAIIENTQRHDLNPIEEAKAYRKLEQEFQMTQEEVAEKMGKSRSAVANKTRLLTLSVEIQKALIEGRITEGHAKALLALDNPEKQRALFELILKDSLTVRQVEGKLRDVTTVKAHARAAADPEARALEDKLAGFFGTKVKLQKSGKSGGKIVVEFYSKEELDGIIGKIIA